MHGLLVSAWLAVTPQAWVFVQNNCQPCEKMQFQTVKQGDRTLHVKYINISGGVTPSGLYATPAIWDPQRNQWIGQRYMELSEIKRLMQ